MNGASRPPATLILNPSVKRWAAAPVNVPMIVKFITFGSPRLAPALRLLLVLGATAIAAAQDSPPDRSGIFYKPADRKWVALEELHRTPGAQRAVTFRGAFASVRITDPKPLFYIRAIPFGSARDCRIVRLDQRAGHRELQARAANAGKIAPVIAPSHAIGFQTIQRSNGDYLLLPREPLTPGEYMITFGAIPIPGYEFGVDRPRIDADSRVAQSRPLPATPQF